MLTRGAVVRPGIHGTRHHGERSRGLRFAGETSHRRVPPYDHTSLTDVATKAGFEAHHVNWRGWSGLTDRKLFEVVVREEFVFVTNNARDFRKIMEEAELHAGLIVIVPNVKPIAQSELFERALHEIARIPDMINKVVEIDSDELRIYELPKLG
jgi:Domain of unknown function (DUF5615)